MTQERARGAACPALLGGLSVATARWCGCLWRPIAPQGCDRRHPAACAKRVRSRRAWPASSARRNPQPALSSARATPRRLSLRANERASGRCPGARLLLLLLDDRGGAVHFRRVRRAGAALDALRIFGHRCEPLLVALLIPAHRCFARAVSLLAPGVSFCARQRPSTTAAQLARGANAAPSRAVSPRSPSAATAYARIHTSTATQQTRARVQ